MDTRPIGVFDSGLGGLTAVRSCGSCCPLKTLYTSATRPVCPTAAVGGNSAEIRPAGRALSAQPRHQGHFSGLRHRVHHGPAPAAAGERHPHSGGGGACVPPGGGCDPEPAGGPHRHRRLRPQRRLPAQSAPADPDIAVTAKACPLFVPLVENGRFRRGDVVIETVAGSIWSRCAGRDWIP